MPRPSTSLQPTPSRRGSKARRVSAVASEPPPVLLSLPPELIQLIVDHFRAAELLAAAPTCRTLREPIADARLRLLKLHPPMLTCGGFSTDDIIGENLWLHLLACADAVMDGATSSRSRLTAMLRHVKQRGVVARPAAHRKVFKTHFQLVTAIAVRRLRSVRLDATLAEPFDAALRRLHQDSPYSSPSSTLANVALLHSPDLQVQRAAAIELSRFRGQANYVQERMRRAIDVTAADGVALLASLLRRDPASSQRILRVMRFIARVDAEKVLATGIVPLVVRGLTPPVERPGYGIDLLIAIMNERPEQRAAIAAAGAIPVLVQTILPSASSASHVHVRASTLGAAAEALRCLTHDNPPNRIAVAHAGGLAPLLALASMADFGCQKYAAAALGNLVYKNEPNLRALREVGGVQLLERLARGREPAVAEAARRALATNGIGHWGRSRAGAFVLRDDLGRACPRKQALTR